jgi:uncharacterized protein YfaS (alpha-2-macroglobulin family)
MTASFRCAFALLAYVIASCATTAAAQSVLSFSPQGEVKRVRQATARFAAAMVPFGDPREVDPFTVDCPAPGKGRWADPRNWVYDFEADLPAGLRCTFTLREGQKDLAGQLLAAGQKFTFNTGGPAILEMLPREGATIDEDQVFIVGLDAAATPESVLAHASCSAAGIHERIPVRIVTGDERKKLLDIRKYFVDQYLRVLLLDARTGTTRAFGFRLPTKGNDRDKFLKLRDAPDSPLLVLACTRTLPAATEAKLVWGAGIAATTGLATAKDQLLAFKVRPPFRASFSCDRANKDAQCIPVLPMSLRFSAPIKRVDAAAIRLVDAKGKAWPAAAQPAKGIDWVDSVTFGPGLPEMTTFRIELPANLRDDAGRALANARSFPLTVRTDQSPPLVKFAADFGILESRAGPSGPLLPVTVRNVEPVLNGHQLAKSSATAPIPGRVARLETGDEVSIVGWLRRLHDGQKIDATFDQKTEKWIVQNTGAAVSVFKPSDRATPITVPKPLGQKAFEVIGIPLKTPGYYVVELASPRLGASLFGEPRPYFARTSVLVTNLGVHFKRGRESSLAWVTRLDDGLPVADADVSVLDCGGRVHWRGKSDASGLARVETPLPDVAQLPGCLDRYDRAYFVVARSGGDMSFAFSNWDSGISPWRYNLPTARYGGPYVTHAVFDRSLLRAGDTVSMKVYVRKQTGAGFSLVPQKALPAKATIEHQGTERKFDTPLTWSGARSATAAFVVPKDAPLGTYRVTLPEMPGLDAGGDRDEHIERELGVFRVEEFRVPLLRARVQPLGGPFVNAEAVPIDVQVSYLAGGAAGGLPVKLRTQSRPRDVTFVDYDDYAFAAGDVKEGRQDSGDSENEEDEEAATAAAASGAVTETDLTLDGNGGARATVSKIARADRPRDLVAELEYRDPNGETLTAATRVPLWTSDVVLGLKRDAWAAVRDRVKFTVVAVDPRGRPLPNTRVDVDAFKRETYSHRRRLIGGFYAYQHGSETTRLGVVCEGSTNAQGLLVCDSPAPDGASGNLILRARAKDAAGNAAVTRADVWIATGDDWWFEAGDNDRIDLLPEKKAYAPGDVARLQVRTPFKTATALVTVEREGVLEAFVRPLSRDNPVLEVPLTGNYAPNVFISAFLVRGRIGGIAPTALVDLAKPSFKMGVAELKVGWTAHTLNVKVAADKDVYRTRGTATIDIDVRRADGSAPPAGTEVALAAVDEGLLELLPNTSWRLLDAMMTRRGLEVETATAQMQVIGRRHFGRKAVAAGGGGGRSPARELFDTLLVWKATVPLDANGHARVSVPLNDSLTGFRVVAVADGAAGWFGTGETTIRTTQPLLLLGGLPQVVREGDRLRAGFTVRNASQTPQSVRVNGSVTPTAKDVAALPPLAAQELTLAPGEARDIGWDVDVPVNAGTLQWRVDATAKSGGETFSDALAASVPVRPAIPERTYQATILQLTAPQTMEVARPADALPGRGGVDVTFQSKLAGTLPGVATFLERYMYTCFEQRASVAIGLRSRPRWDALMAALPAYLDGDGLVKFFPILAYGDDFLTAYVLSLADEAGYPIPDAHRKRMEDGLIGFVEGRVVRYSALPTADLAIRKLSALEALSRRKGPFPPRWLDTFVVEPNLWPTSAVIDYYLIVKRQPALPKHAERIAEAEQILRSRLNFQGTTMGFSTERSDTLWWLMVSGDVNANRLLLAMLDAPAWKEDMPRLVRGSLGRMQRGRWGTTVANAWGVVALDKFSAAFEATPVVGGAAAVLGDKTYTQKFTGSEANERYSDRFPWPPQQAPLALAHDGPGAPWVTVQSVAAIPLKTPLSTGYAITRRIAPVQQKTAGRWSVGDIARVTLDIDAQSDMTWVVVSDPVPTGASILGRGFGTESTIATTSEQRSGWSWPAFEERTASDFRAYYRYLPKGRISVEYSVRLNNAGRFGLPGTRAEAMYAPEMFGELALSEWSVER